jgi:hypothetical protein
MGDFFDISVKKTASVFICRYKITANAESKKASREYSPNRLCPVPRLQGRVNGMPPASNVYRKSGGDVCTTPIGVKYLLSLKEL